MVCRCLEPQCKIPLIAFVGVRVFQACADGKFVQCVAAECAIVVKGCDIKKDIAIFFVGVPRCDEFFDEVNHVRDVFGGAWIVMRGEDIHFLLCGKGIRFIKARNLLRRLFFFGGGFCHFVGATVALRNVVVGQVSDVGDVFDHTHFIAAVGEVAADEVGIAIGAQITDVDIVINCRTACVHAHFAGVDGRERIFALGEGVVEREHSG